MKHASKFCQVYPTISSKVMVIGVLLAYLGTADNGKKPSLIWEEVSHSYSEAAGEGDVDVGKPKSPNGLSLNEHQRQCGRQLSLQEKKSTAQQKQAAAGCT
jgi:hypothetical protein